MSSLIVLVRTIAILAVASSVAFAQQLRIFHIDVEQGSSTLFVMPNGRALLVDSGENGQGDRVVALLGRLGIDTVDDFVATHYHSDHIGGIDEVVHAGVVVDRAFDRGTDGYAIPTSNTYQDYAAALSGRRHHIVPGDTILLDSSVRIQCVASGGAVVGESEPSPGTDENDNSVALELQFDGFRYFIGGDIEARTERLLAEEDAVTDVDVYVADHHGAATSSTKEFVDDMRPTVVVISNGSNAIYRHPREVVLERFAHMHPAPTVFQTNYLFDTGSVGGNVDTAFIGDRDEHDDDGTVVVRVDGAAGTYAVDCCGGSEWNFPVKHPAVPAVVSHTNTNADTNADTNEPGGTQQHVPRVVIARLLPNPVGSDDELEEVTIENVGTDSVNVDGWVLRDASNGIWVLPPGHVLAPGQTLTIVRHGMSMSLNNGGDTIELLDTARAVVDRVEYGRVREGEEVRRR